MSHFALRDGKLDHPFIVTCDHDQRGGACPMPGLCHQRSGELGDVICAGEQAQHHAEAKPEAE